MKLYEQRSFHRAIWQKVERGRKSVKLVKDLLIPAHEVKCQLDDSAAAGNIHNSADSPSWQTAINHPASRVAIIF